MRTERRRFFESMMLAPNRSAILFLLWAAVAGIVALPGRHWPHHSLVILLVLTLLRERLSVLKRRK